MLRNFSAADSESLRNPGLHFIDNLDTTDIFPSQQISNLITSSDGLDTIGFQENVYLETDERIITTVLLYTNSTFKEELKLAAKESK